MIRTMLLFFIAGLAEIGGVYLIWQWIRSGKPILFALLGLVALFLYGLTQTLQVFSFGRAFAAYGGYSSPWPWSGAGGLMAVCRIVGIGSAWLSVS